MPASTTSRSHRRADAARSVTAILDAALICLCRDPDASVTEIAKYAGVGRVTVYGHFQSREELLEAVFGHAVAEAERALSAVDIDSGPADEALVALVRSGWRVLDAHRRLLLAAHRHLPADRLRAHHRRNRRRVDRLIARGQRDGVFRVDLPRTWLVTCFYSVLHTAADEVESRRLSRLRAPAVLTETLLALLRA